MVVCDIMDLFIADGAALTLPEPDIDTPLVEYVMAARQFQFLVVDFQDIVANAALWNV